MEAFYGGAAGGGKSDALLAGALQYVDVPGYAALILRRTFTDLAIPGAAMARSKQWLTGKAHWADREKTWTFPSAAALTFGYLEHEDDVYRYQSAEFQFIGFDELTQFTEAQYRYLFSRLRATEEVPVPLRMRAASNPGNIGHGWVKRRLIKRETREPGVIFVPAKLSDHPDAGYKAGYRLSLSKLDPVKRRQLEDGDWDIAEGLAFDIRPGVHFVPDMDVPQDWERFESMDFGVANPTVVLAWAVDYDGNVIVFDSYYQADTLVSDHARAIEARRRVWRTTVCYADPSMWAKKGGVSKFGEPATDVTEFEDNGIKGLVQANNRRRAGRIRVTELLKREPGRLFPGWHPWSGTTGPDDLGAPRMFIVADRCAELAHQLQDAPLLPIDSGKEGAGEIVEPTWESQDGHAVAACRYGAMSRPAPSKPPPPSGIQPDKSEDEARQQFLQDVYRKRRKPAAGRTYFA